MMAQGWFGSAAPLDVNAEFETCPDFTISR